MDARKKLKDPKGAKEARKRQNEVIRQSRHIEVPSQLLGFIFVCMIVGFLLSWPLSAIGGPPTPEKYWGIWLRVGWWLGFVPVGFIRFWWWLKYDE
nr:hypothetical protein [Candidatus Sigynarchaeota archaeon]